MLEQIQAWEMPERAVLRRALAAKPQDRHPTCTDFAADLADALGLPFAGGGHRVSGRGAGPGHPPLGAVFGSAAAFESGSLPIPVDTGDGGGTVVIDSLRKKPQPEPEPPEDEPAVTPPKPTRGTGPLIVAGSLGLIALERVISPLQGLAGRLVAPATELMAELESCLGDRGVLLITHYTRILNYIKPDFVHVFVDGRIAEEGGPELAANLEVEGYERFVRAAAAS